jgi:hypothetical protein
VSSTVLVYVEDAADLVLVADAFEIGNSKKLINHNYKGNKRKEKS